MAMKYRSAVLLAAGAIALIFVTSGTTAFAARTLITGSDIARGTITGANIATGTIDSTDIKNRSITAADIAPGTIKLSHLNRSSIRSGHLHSSAALKVVNPRIVSPRVTTPGVNTNAITPQSTMAFFLAWNNGGTTVAAIPNLPAGTYLILATGEVSANAVSNGSTTFYETEVICEFFSGTNLISSQYYSPGVYAQHSSWSMTAAMSHVITTTASANLTFTCLAQNLHSNPGGMASVDLVALPVNSISAG